jgi:hypothetical protein
MITPIEYVQLFALIAFAGFISYTVHEVANAIDSILHDWGNMSRYLPDGYVDYATYNIKEVLQFLQQLLGIISESW